MSDEPLSALEGQLRAIEDDYTKLGADQARVQEALGGLTADRKILSLLAQVTQTLAEQFETRRRLIQERELELQQKKEALNCALSDAQEELGDWRKGAKSERRIEDEYAAGIQDTLDELRGTLAPPGEEEAGDDGADTDTDEGPEPDEQCSSCKS